MNQATSYVYGAQNPTFTVNVTTGSLCPTKWFITPTGFPASITTGASWPSSVVTVNTTIIRVLELDIEGTSWTGVCNNAQANISLSGNNSFITV
jgi:hypothetical protein